MLGSMSHGWPKGWPSSLGCEGRRATEDKDDQRLYSTSPKLARQNSPESKRSTSSAVLDVVVEIDALESDPEPICQRVHLRSEFVGGHVPDDIPDDPRSRRRTCSELGDDVVLVERNSGCVGCRCDWRFGRGAEEGRVILLVSRDMSRIDVFLLLKTSSSGRWCGSTFGRHCSSA